MTSKLLLAKKCCDQCLTTRNRIVSEERAEEIIAECERERKHFFCHKGTIAGQPIHCRGVHEQLGGSTAYQFAKAFGIPIEEVDPNARTD